MAGKTNDRLPNNHLLITGGSGSGKTTYANRKRLAKSAMYRRVYYDPDKTHNAVHVERLSVFCRELERALKSGKKFRLAYAPQEPNKEDFQWWCGIVWLYSDSRLPMDVIVEELHQVTGSGEAIGNWKALLTRGRKYGVSIVAISQRPQEIDKTTLSQCENKITGALHRDVDRRVMARELSCKVADIEALATKNDGKSLHYIGINRGKKYTDSIRF